MLVSNITALGGVLFGTSEWFALSDALRDHITTVGAGVDDPWDAYARWVSDALALRG
jgi:hypothetical protein